MRFVGAVTVSGSGTRLRQGDADCGRPGFAYENWFSVVIHDLTFRMIAQQFADNDRLFRAEGIERERILHDVRQGTAYWIGQAGAPLRRFAEVLRPIDG
jgi:hypothetical protein